MLGLGSLIEWVRAKLSPTNPMTEPKQSALEEIVESERELMLTADQRYGRYYRHARSCSVFLSKCITQVGHDRLMFSRFFTLTKNHHMLALLSVVRLHRVQAMMDLRQVLEAGAAAAFALANPQLRHFADIDDRGILEPSQKLAKDRYRWLHKHYPGQSDLIKKKKGLINDQSSHANVANSAANFTINDAGDAIKQTFFDKEDDFRVKNDLLLISGIAIELMELMYGVNIDLMVIEFIPNFSTLIKRVAEENNALLAEMKSHPRFKRAVKKYGIQSRK